MTLPNTSWHGRAPAKASATLLLVALLTACADPGSGGTGVPTSSAPATSAPVPAPVTAPAPGAAPPADVSPTVDACTAPAPVGAEPFTGLVTGRSGSCLAVESRAVRIDQALLLRRSGAVASIDELVVGVRVTVEPEPGDGRQARRVTIEDLPT